MIIKNKSLNLLKSDARQKKKKKRSEYSRFFLIFDLDKVFREFCLFIFPALSSTSVCPKIHLIWSKSELEASLKIREGLKLNVTNVLI